jgi:membrane protease YdiL (CAAX protease family)
MERSRAEADLAGAMAAAGAIAATRALVATYIVGICVAEVVFVFVDPLYGMLCHAVLLFALLHHGIAARRSAAEREMDASVRNDLVFPVLALVPLLRILSITMPIPQAGRIYWYGLIGVPVALALVLLARVASREWLRRAVPFPWSRVQAAVAVSGVPLGMIAYLIARHDGFSMKPDGHELLVAVPLLFFFTGVLEEVLFRGLLQRALVDLYGAPGRLWTTALFAFVYLGSRSAGYVAFYAGVGFLFSWVVTRTRSLAGVMVAHGFLAVSSILIWPYLLK